MHDEEWAEADALDRRGARAEIETQGVAVTIPSDTCSVCGYLGTIDLGWSGTAKAPICPACPVAESEARS